MAVSILLTYLVTQGIPIPDNILTFLGPETFQAVLGVFTSVIGLYQLIRGREINKIPDTHVFLLSEGQKRSYKFNPFKTSLT